MPYPKFRTKIFVWLPLPVSKRVKVIVLKNDVPDTPTLAYVVQDCSMLVRCTVAEQLLRVGCVAKLHSTLETTDEVRKVQCIHCTLCGWQGRTGFSINMLVVLNSHCPVLR